MDFNVLHEISQLQFHPSHTPYTKKTKTKALQVITKKEEKEKKKHI
jgi:hypothetical protein